MADMVTVSQVEEGARLHRWFLRRFPAMPQRQFYKLCRGGQIRVNSSRVSGNEILRAGDVVRIPPTVAGYANAPKKSEAGDAFSLADLESLRQCIIHDDNDIVVFDKPAGLAVQGGTGIRKSVDKMAAALFPYDKIALVHRLDRETSGILVVAKNQTAAQKLAAQFQNKTAQKQYLALLNGRVSPERGIIDNYMLKGQVFDSPRRLDGGTGPRPQHAVTEYSVLTQAAGMLSWVLFSPKTGRTHQLRVHSAVSLNAPIVGDALYGNGGAMPGLDSLTNTKNLFLFAHKITFQHPSTGRLITLRAQMPEFMQPVVRLLELKLP